MTQRKPVILLAGTALLRIRTALDQRVEIRLLSIRDDTLENFARDLPVEGRAEIAHAGRQQPEQRDQRDRDHPKCECHLHEAEPRDAECAKTAVGGDTAWRSETALG